MSAQISGWLAAAWATDSPALPSTSAMQVWLHLGWSVVLAWLVAGVVARLTVGWSRAAPVQWLTAFCLAAWAWVPGPIGAAYWLGLAFQAPSAGCVLVCAALLGKRCRAVQGKGLPLRFPEVAGPSVSPVFGLAWIGVLLGWALLLDSFAVLPMQLYAWGFSPVALFLVVVVALLPWVVRGQMAPPHLKAGYFVVPLAALVFVAWRLPTGNVWDAVLDPWLWLGLQVWLFRRALERYKKRSCLRLSGGL